MQLQIGFSHVLITDAGGIGSVVAGVTWSESRLGPVDSPGAPLRLSPDPA